MALGEWLRAVRLKRGMTQEQVAFSAGIDVSTYARIERQRDVRRFQATRIGTVIRILRVLGVPAKQMDEFAEAYW